MRKRGQHLNKSYGLNEGRVKELLQDVPRLQELLEKIQRAQQSHEKQLSALRRFSKHVEQHLEQIADGALPPRQSRQTSIG